MAIDIEIIKQLREETGAAVLDVKKALDNTDGNVAEAKKELIAKGQAKAAKKQAEREVKDGLIHAYIHAGGKVGALVMLACETDFVAKTDEFDTLCHDIAMQVAAGDYENVQELLEDDFLRDPSKKVADLVGEAIAKLGEKIEVVKFVKFSVSEV